MWFVLTAFAADPIALVDDGTLVHSIDWARPFELQQPHPYRYFAEETSITTGWLVQLTVESWTMFPRQVGVPNVWVGDRIAGRTQWSRDTEGTFCAVVWVPGDVELTSAPVFFGTTELAERLDEPRRQQVVAAAKALPPVQKRSDIENEPVRVEEFGDLMAIAAGRCR